MIYARVGDILLSARESVPDLPGVLPAPLQSDLSFAGSAGGTLPPAVYYLKATYSTYWGETRPGPETTVTLSGLDNGITLNPASCPYLSVVSAINVYLGQTSGGEVQKYVFPVTLGSGGPYIVTGSGFIFSTPPQGNSAFVLDSGGPVASASQIFRWFSDALNSIATANGGIPDVTGFQTTGGQANYQMPGDWKSFDAGWYDGYPQYLGSGSLVYRHNTIMSIGGMLSYTQVADTVVVEVFPQPVRTGGQTTTNAATSANANQVTTNGLTGFVLPFGLASLSNPATGAYEIVSYTSVGNNLANLIRGLGGTSPQAWPAGTTVTELNVYMSGMRQAQQYDIGGAATTVRIPSEWVPLMHTYILARYRRIEQNEEDTKTLMEQFSAGLKSATKKKAILGERQIQPQDETMVDVFPGLSRTFGGLIIP